MTDDTDIQFMAFVGIVIISSCIGYLTKPVYGWLAFGVSLLLIAIGHSMFQYLGPMTEDKPVYSINKDDLE